MLKNIYIIIHYDLDIPTYYFFFYNMLNIIFQDDK